MILGIGSDLSDIRRVEQTLERFGERFTNRVFTEIERTRSERKNDKASSYAKRFAAKEACAKALGTGIRRGVFWRDMGVVNMRSGQPTMALTGGAHWQQHADAVTASGLGQTQLGPGEFSDNFTMWAPQIRTGVVHDIAPDAVQSPVSMRDIARVETRLCDSLSVEEYDFSPLLNKEMRMRSCVCRRGSASAENDGNMAMPAPAAVACCWARILVLRNGTCPGLPISSRNSSSLLNSRSSM